MSPRSINCCQSRRPEMAAPMRRRSARLILAIAAPILLGLLTTACSTIGPRPWERDLMAKPEMQLNPYPLKTAADDHIYFSKEASSGGRSFAGGGCGCN